MANLNKHVLAASLLLCTWCVAGCSKTPPASTPPGQGAAPTGSTGTAPSTASQLTLTVYVNMDESDMQTFANPDDSLIEKQVRALNWQNPQQRPYVHLARIDASGGSYVKLQGTQGTPNTDGLFRAMGLGLAGPGTFRESPPLESVDAGLKILLLFRNDREGLKAAVRDWKTEDTQ